jgi:Big-like domain-containing protein
MNRYTRVAAVSSVLALAFGVVTAAHAQAATPVAAVNFQPVTSAVPSGYLADTGAAFDATRGYGWIRQDSVGSATHVPLDLTRNTRDRARAGIDARLNTMIHMQYGDITPPQTKGEATPGAWEYAVGPGRYTVTVSVGDQSPYNSVHVIRVEGSTAIDHFTSTATAEYATGTVTVAVTDGRLTVDAIGGTNTKLDYLQISKVSDDTTPPATPTGLTAAAGDGQVSLVWTANTDADLLGYRVYRGGAVVSGPGVLTRPSFVDTTAVNGTAYSYAVSAVDSSGNDSPASSPVTATPAAFALKVNFSDQATPPPAGYVADFGEAYGPHTNGFTYGWVQLGTGTPVSLVGNGRNRGAASDPDVRLATFVHAQLPAVTAGVHTPGTWELAVPNGAYTVTVAVGDAGTAVNSDNYINVEDQNAIAEFVPTAMVKHATVTRTVTVTDGRLTVSPASGTNTKFDYVDVASVPGSAAVPSVRTSSPANLAGNASTTGSVVEDLRLPSGGVDTATLTSTSVTLTKVADGTAVPANVITSGGGDVINLSPTAALAPNTLYRFTVTPAVHDVNGHAFAPYSTVFATGAGGTGAGPAAFEKAVSGAVTAMYTSVVKGPDGKLYAATLDGHIYRYPINPDGTLGVPVVIDTVRSHATAAGLPGAPNRTIIGLAFDPASTASNPVLWVSDNYEFVGTFDVPDWSSHLAKLSGPNLGTYTDVLTNLPRSVKDHETNSITFGPDGALYFAQGANNAMGDADATWGNRPEHLLNAAILRLDPARLPATLPLDVKTDDGGTYNPYAPGAPLTIYATGVRNAFDLVWHRNGHLYAPTNGSAASGNAPATPSPLPAQCAGRPDGAYTAPAVPAIVNNPQAETDYLFDVKPGRYYGHPNPRRCEWVLAGGNPTANADPFQVDAYPAGTLPDRNYDLADVYDAGMHASADGAIEYHGGALDGKLLVVRYSAGQDIETFDIAPTGKVSNQSTGIPGFTGFNQPLDLAEDNATGDLYVTELGASRITLLRPVTASAGPKLDAPARLVFSAVKGTTSPARPVLLRNVGGSPLTITAVTTAAPFAVSTPTLPATVAPGASITASVTFAPGATAPGPVGGLLTVASNGGTARVTLRGLGTNGVGGTSEPSLQWILDTWQIPVDVGDPDPTTSLLPTTNPLGPDEVPLQTMVKARDDSPVTATPIAAYGSQKTDPAIRWGWYTPTGVVRHEQFTVPASAAQSLAPAAPVTFDPGTGAFGLYSEWPPFGNRDVYSEDRLNTFDPAVAHHVRAYPMRNPDGTTVPDTYVVTTEEITSNQDYQDIVLIVSNVRPASGGTGAVTLTSLDGVPANNRLVFSAIGTPADANEQTHKSATVRIRNTGSGPLTVTGLPVVGPPRPCRRPCPWAGSSPSP